MDVFDETYLDQHRFREIRYTMSIKFSFIAR